jgi:hypothetical protein
MRSTLGPKRWKHPSSVAFDGVKNVVDSLLFS